MEKIIIIGAGFSGLSLAHELVKFGFEVEVFEKKDQVGGLISSPMTEVGFYETGANGFLNSAAVEIFLREIGVTALGSSLKSKNRYIFRKKPTRWPLNLLQSFYFLFKLIIFLSKSKAARAPRPEQSIQQWGELHLGKTAVNFLLGPALQGIYAGNLNELSSSLVLNPFFNRVKVRKKSKSQSSLVSSQFGMGQIMLMLQKSLENKGVKFHFGQTWTSEIAAAKTVIATSAFDALGIMNQIYSDPAVIHNRNLIKKIESLGLVSVTCFFASKPKNYQGFGILFPRSEKIRVLGVLMNSIIFDRDQVTQKNYYSETWIFGGATDPQILDLSDFEIIQEIEAVRPRVFQEQQFILKTNITRWPNALPYYNIALEKNLKEIRPMKSIILHGNYLGVLGLSRILERSQHIAAQIQQELMPIKNTKQELL